MYRDETINIEVTDWPAVGRSTRISLDSRIFRDADEIGEACRKRYGNGSLKPCDHDHNGDAECYQYKREIKGPGDLLKAFSFLLNKSYS